MTEEYAYLLGNTINEIENWAVHSDMIKNNEIKYQEKNLNKECKEILESHNKLW